MKLFRSGCILSALASLLLQSANLSAQDVLGNVLRMGYTDMAEVKRLAESGDTKAQVILANTLSGNFHPDEALTWYRKAVAAGNLEAIYKAGKILFNGGVGIPSEHSVKADPPAGLQLIYRAATNGYRDAFHDMYRAYNDGRGVAKDSVQAYAWLQLDVDTGPMLGAVSRVELNNLALAVDVNTSQAGKRLAAQFKAGHWPPLITRAEPPQPTTAPGSVLPGPAANQKQNNTLKLNGIVQGRKPLAIINGKGLAEGESATLPLKPQPITFKCLKIETNAALVLVEGEDAPRRLISR